MTVIWMNEAGQLNKAEKVECIYFVHESKPFIKMKGPSLDLEIDADLVIEICR